MSKIDDSDFCKDCPEKQYWPDCDSNYACPYNVESDVFCPQCGLLRDECICLGDGGYDLERIEEE